MMDTQQRLAITTEAITWKGTPFVYGACVKHVGVDCGRFPAAVLKNVGLLPDLNLATLPQLPPMWFLHCTEELYPPIIALYATEYQLSKGEIPQPGDVVIAKYGRDYAHSALVLAWPKIIAAACEHCVCIWQNIHTSPQYAGRALRYFNPLVQPVQK